MLNKGSDLPDTGVSLPCNKESKVFNKRSVSADWTESANTDQYAPTILILKLKRPRNFMLHFKVT